MPTASTHPVDVTFDAGPHFRITAWCSSVLWPAMRKLLVSSLLALTLLPACSGSGGDGSDALAERMAAAARQVAVAGTYRFEGTVVHPVGPETSDVPVEGVADTGSTGAEADVEPFTRMDLDLTRSPLPGARAGLIRMIIKGRTAYLRFPEGDRPGTGTAPGGRLWGKFALGSEDQSGEGLKLLIDRGRSAAPARSLALLTGARDVDQEGTETIRDVETRRFTMTTDIGAIAGRSSIPFAAGAKDLLDTIGAVTVSVEVWLGPDDLPRRVAYTLDPADRRDLTSVTIDLFDYGTPVERDLPPDADVFDFSALSGAGG